MTASNSMRTGQRSCRGSWLVLLPFAVFLLLSLSGLAQAERPKQRKEDATYIVTGKVMKIFSHDQGAEMQYIVQISIGAMEKGEGYRPGESIYAYAFQRKASAGRETAARGHSAIPESGTQIRAWINRARGKMEGVYPAWFEVLKDAPAR